MDLEEALEQFDAVEANLRRLETVWAEMQGLIPTGISFADATAEGRRYSELTRAWTEIVGGLPPIGEHRITAVPRTLNEIAQNRLDASEIDELDAIVSVEEGIQDPGRDIDDYRFRLTRARRELVRDRMIQLIAEIDAALPDMANRITSDSTPVTDPTWGALVAAASEVERLAGNSVPRKGRWGELRRHIAWGQGQDLHDIANHDWPSVRGEIQANLYSELEPLPVSVENLENLVATRPTGRVTTKLKWDQIGAEEFERLLFNRRGRGPASGSSRSITRAAITVVSTSPSSAGSRMQWTARRHGRGRLNGVPAVATAEPPMPAPHAASALLCAARLL